MKQLLLTLAATILLTGAAFAQGPGEDKAAVSAPATATQKATAKAERKAQGVAVAKATQPGDDRPGTSAKKAAKAERKLAAAQRKAAGAKVSKQPKEPATTTN